MREFWMFALHEWINGFLGHLYADIAGLDTNFLPTGLDSFWGTYPLNHLPDLPLTLCYLLWQSLKFKVLQIEAIAQGATVCNFLLVPT